MLKKIILPILATMALAGNVFAADFNGNFEKKAKKIKGSWTLTQVDGQQVIRFNDDFKTKNGPDLKVFLSKKSVDNLSKNPTFIAPVNIGLIESVKGRQEYVVPADINLADFESILIHCEKYNILWGGFDIPDEATAPAVEAEAYGS